MTSSVGGSAPAASKPAHEDPDSDEGDGDDAGDPEDATAPEQTASIDADGRGRELSLSGVSHGFDGTPVLDGVDLAVRRGETLAVIGPSGTGKTTLLRLLAAFHPPDEGRAAFDGEDLWALSERERRAVRRRIGMVFQEASLFSASVRANASYGLRIRRGWTDRVRWWLARAVGRESPDGVIEALDVVGLADEAERHASSLSGGEAQRVAFARALAYDPAFLLLDEPTSDLDPRNTALIETAVETARARNVGVAIATHDMHQAERVADRVAVVLDGRVVEVGPAERVFENPRDERTRAFIEGDLVY